MTSTVVRLESRVKQLEVDVRDLKARLLGVPESPWYRQILGTFADDPVFDEIVRLGGELRAAERNPSRTKGTARQRRKVDS